METAAVDLLFEVSWEVCNKVGGIHTVITTKIDIMEKYYPNYFLIGPYFKDQAKLNFERKKAPREIDEVFEKLEKKGIKCYYGKWLLKEEHDTILIDSSKFFEQKNKIKEQLWEGYKIDSIRSGWEFEEPLVWATAVGIVLEEFCRSRLYSNRNIVAHFHEWMAGITLLYLKQAKVKIGTVFTTHATMLGRALAGSGYDLYNILDSINPDREAYNLNIQDKYLTEKACAHHADVFTTVSEITAIEAEKTLGRKPDILTLNGIDTRQFPTVEEFSIRHVTCRNKIRDFLTFHFFPYYTFDLDKTMLIYISGRYEFKNKGIDMFIKALGKLNDKLKSAECDRTIAVFLWVPQETFGIKTEILENKNYYTHIRNYVNYNSDNILSKIVHDLVSQRDISKKSLLTKEFQHELKRDLMTFKRKGNPPMITHHIREEENDPVMNMLKATGLDNKKDDCVKVIYQPVYLEGNDGLLNLQYYDAIAGCHLGVFPSYYEPWGYTPMESLAVGVPAITSNLAGFGKFVESKIKDNIDDGIFILDRFNKNDEEVLQDFIKLLCEFIPRDKHQRAKNKLHAKELSSLADWNILIENYILAHRAALNKLKKE